MLNSRTIKNISALIIFGILLFPPCVRISTKQFSGGFNIGHHFVFDIPRNGNIDFNRLILQIFLVIFVSWAVKKY